MRIYFTSIYTEHSIIVLCPVLISLLTNCDLLINVAVQNVFIHFEPLGYTLQHEERNSEEEESLEQLYQQAWEKLKSKCGDDSECQSYWKGDLNVADKVPPYIIPGSEEEMRWLQAHPKARLVSSFPPEKCILL